MELLVILVIVAIGIALLVTVRRRRFFNRGRGAVSGRWNRRI